MQAKRPQRLQGPGRHASRCLQHCPGRRTRRCLQQLQLQLPQLLLLQQPNEGLPLQLGQRRLQASWPAGGCTQPGCDRWGWAWQQEMGVHVGHPRWQELRRSRCMGHSWQRLPTCSCWLNTCVLLQWPLGQPSASLWSWLHLGGQVLSRCPHAWTRPHLPPLCRLAQKQRRQRWQKRLAVLRMGQGWLCQGPLLDPCPCKQRQTAPWRLLKIERWLR